MKFRIVPSIASIVLSFLALAVSACAYSPFAAETTSSLNVTVSGDKWVDTGMNVQAGDKLHITATGTVTMGNNAGITANGAARGWVDTLRALMVPSAGRGALVGRVGDSNAATPFFIGANGTVLAPISGRLYLAINTDSLQTSGWQVRSSHRSHRFEYAYGEWRGGGPEQLQLPAAVCGVGCEAALSRDDRANGGNQGDLVNFVLVGTQAQVTSALKAAGWIAADKTDKEAVVSALLATLQKNVYVSVPMSILYLFGRPQDFGYERAEAVMVAAQRNHFRIWQTPFAGPQNQVLWAGAGTHDVGIEPDQRSEDASRTRSIRMWITSATSSARRCSRRERWRRCRT